MRSLVPASSNPQDSAIRRLAVFGSWMMLTSSVRPRSRAAQRMAAATGQLRAQVEATLSATLTRVRGAVASGDKVQLPGFGTFEPRERGARTARNPSTGAPLQLAATRAVGFKVGATFKQEVADSVTAKTPTKAAAKKTPAKATTSKTTAAKKAAKK